MRDVLLIGIGGFMGAILRYWVSGAAHLIAGTFQFPVGTLTVNVVGSFILAFLVNLAEILGLFGPSLRAFAFIGLLGAFTTFSTFSLETGALLMEGEGWLAVVNVIINLGLCLFAIFLARALTIRIWG